MISSFIYIFVYICCPLALGKTTKEEATEVLLWSVALHGAETWTLRRNDQKPLEALEMWIWGIVESVK